MATTPSRSRTVSQFLAERLTDLAVTSVFGLMGEDTAALVTALAHQQGVDVVTTRHEAAAVMAADSFAWATDGLGIAILSHGPGFTNGLTAAISAVRADRQLLLIAGHDATNPVMTPDLKRSDQAGIARAAGVAVYVARDAEAVASSTARAVDEARSGRTVLLSIPVDVLNGPASMVSAPETVPEAGRRARPAASDIAQLATLLGQSQRPLILAGRGALGARAELEELGDQAGALLGTTLVGRGLFHGHPRDVGLIGGWASDSARPLLDGVDLVVAFGASLNSFTLAFGNLFTRARVVQIDVDPARLGVNRAVHMGIVGDSAESAAALVACLDSHQAASTGGPRAPVPEAGRLFLGEDRSVQSESDPDVLAAILDEIIPEPRTVVSDAGHFAGATGRYMRVRQPNHFRLTAAFASIGLGIGAAIGAAVARPEEQTVLVVGDGGMMMSLGDLETVARYELPLLIVVMNDRAWGAERHFLDMMGLPHDQAVFGNVDFAALSRSLGIDGKTVRSPAELKALKPELSEVRRTPLLIDCKIRGDLRASWLDEMA